MRFSLLALVFLLFSAPLLAEDETRNDAYAWLQTIALAPYLLNYSGTYVHQCGNQIETSKIKHMVDESGSHEKIETLDGVPQEIIRNNEQATCYFSKDSSVIVEKRKVLHFFPAILPVRLDDIFRNYVVRITNKERVGGYECQNIYLEPKDPYRYAHVFCADVNSGLLLKTAMLNEKRETVNQYAFIELKVAGKIDKNQLQTSFQGKKMIDVPQVAAPGSSSKVGQWVIKPLPAGFNVIKQSRHPIQGKKMPIDHLVFSDGLVSVSVFIEPMTEASTFAQSISKRKSINVYTRSLKDYQITVLGEVPSRTVMQIGNSVQPK
jgi:sigma-E factor negative regulatory protein RseB